MANQGFVTYPGIVAYESFSITDVSGISPAVGVMEVYPQFGLPSLFGDLVLTYEDHTITFKDCTIDAASFQRNSGGQIVSVRFLDERWKWKYGWISGRYNIRLPNNDIDPVHEATPQELATWCFEAMGVTNFQVTSLPNDARPNIDWDYANPAQELARLCDDLGCRIVPQRSTGQWQIVITGEGATLPDQYPWQDAGDGIDPKELPDYIKIIPAPIRYQVTLELEPIGKETDLSWKPLRQLSYAPDPQGVNNGYGFGDDYQQMSGISNQRFLLPDGSRISPQELALQSVFRCWRVADEPATQPHSTNVQGESTIAIPGFGFATRRQLVLSDQLVQLWTDERGGEHPLPAFVFGSFYGEYAEENGNYPPGTRIDGQGELYGESEEESASFSLTVDPEDTDRSILSTSKPMVYATRVNEISSHHFAQLYLTCTVQVRDPHTWQPVRYEYLKQLGTGTNPDFCLQVIKNDIQPWYLSRYTSSGAWIRTTNNADEVQRQCRYYADALAKTLETVRSLTRTYIGLYSIDLDGAIEQVSYRISKSGSDTIVSRGTEHDFDIPSYGERRQRDGRRSISEKVKLMQENLERKYRLRGTSHR